MTSFIIGIILLITPFNSYLTVSSTFTGQNMGAGKFKRIKKGVLRGHLILTVIRAAEYAAKGLLKD